MMTDIFLTFPQNISYRYSLEVLLLFPKVLVSLELPLSFVG